jgi:uncharacterized membrane protein YgdD (TMEM256/DUF423 family)
MHGKHWLIAGAVLGALAVGAGAFGAHALKKQLAESNQVANYETAVRYHMFHALALLAVGLVALRQPSLACHVAGACFVFGVLVFSGCLYGLALGGPKILGLVVVVGGVSFIAGWVALAAAAWGLEGGGR